MLRMPLLRADDIRPYRLDIHFEIANGINGTRNRVSYGAIIKNGVGNAVRHSENLGVLR